jgi:hypothetical protein
MPDLQTSDLQMPDPQLSDPQISDPQMPDFALDPASDPASRPDTTDCLFSTILGFMVPFYLAGSGGDRGAAAGAVVELVASYVAATAPELDIVGRLVGFGAAAMDNLRLSMQAGLPDAKVLQYRGNAVALGRLAEQCRKVLEAMQTRRRKAAASRPMPRPRPAPVAPPSQPLPPRDMPPAQPKASADPAPTVGEDRVFAHDVETMVRNAHAMIADLRGRARQSGPDSPEASIARTDLQRSHKSPPAGRAAA